MAKKKAKLNVQKKKKNKKKKRLKIRYGRVFFALFILGLIVYIFLHIFDFSIRNIYVKNNVYLTDQQIIERAKLQNNPSTFQELTLLMKQNLEKDVMIKHVKVEKKGFSSVTITVEENRPLFYDKNQNKTVLLDGTLTDMIYVVPTLINYTPDKLYQKLQKKLSELDTMLLTRISEIEYNPNEVDTSRFLLSMADGNYVYLSLNQFQKINSYVDIIKTFQGKKGILYLDSGEYFKIIEN